MPSQRSLENLKKVPFKPLGEQALASKPVAVKLPKDIDEAVRSLSNPSEWLRRVIVEAARQELMGK